MAPTARTYLRRRLGVLITGAAVLTTLMTVPAAASTPATKPSAPELTRPRTVVPGFLLDGGRYTKFDAPTAVTETAPASINNHGQIVGAYKEAGNATHGFLRDRAGRFTTLDVPGAKGTAIYRINDRGQIVGRYSQTHADIQDPDSIHRGFLLDRGRLTRIDVPGAVETQAVGINNLGQVVGEYTNPDGTFHGFLWRKGRLVTIDKPGAAVTSLIDINNRGQIAGFTLASTEADPLAGARGFLLAKGVKGPFTPIDVPGAPRNLVFGLNDRGQLVGTYENLDSDA